MHWTPSAGLRSICESKPFPVVTSQTSPLAMVVVAAAAAVLSLARQPGEPATDTVWAEDGGIFLHQAVQNGSLDTWLHPYAGYMHLAPRLATAVVRLLPLDDAAAAYAVLSAAGLGALAAFALMMSSAVFSTAAGRWAHVLLAPLLPIALFEALNNVANLHWFLIWGAFWASAVVLRTRGGAGVSAAVLVVAILSDPLTLLLLPLLTLRLLARQLSRPLAGVTVAATLLQLSVVLATSGAGAGVRPSTMELLTAYTARVPAGLLFGITWSQALTARHTEASLAIVAAGSIGLLIMSARRLNCSSRRVVLVASGLSIAYFCVPHYLSWSADRVPTDGHINALIAGRYSIVPCLLLSIPFLLAVERLVPRILEPVASKRDRAAAATGLALMATCVGSAVVDFQYSNFRAEGPIWQTELNKARAQCRGQESDTRQTLAVSPTFYPRIELPCAAVRS